MDEYENVYARKSYKVGIIGVVVAIIFGVLSLLGYTIRDFIESQMFSDLKHKIESRLETPPSSIQEESTVSTSEIPVEPRYEKSRDEDRTENSTFSISYGNLLLSIFGLGLIVFLIWVCH